MATIAIILAAGQGTRMRSRTPKVLHDLCGRPMLLWPVAAAQRAGVEKIVVVGGPDGALAGALPDGAELAVQQRPLGTADAVKAAADHIGEEDTALVLSGDVPLIEPGTLADLLAAHHEASAAATLATMELEDPAGYGRIIRGAEATIVERIVETKRPGDATPEELAVHEVNGGVYVFHGGALLAALAQVQTSNAQGEYYLPDVVALLRAAQHAVIARRVTDHAQLRGVNDGVQLAEVRALAQRRIVRRHLLGGVTIEHPAATLIEAGVEIGADTVIEPGSTLRGHTRIGEGCRIGPHTTLIDASVADGARVIHSYVVEATVGAAASVGPFAYLRPGAHLHEQAKAGTFVEIKNSQIGAGAKVPHLSYIGDADVGAGTNLGAATITANYDGHNKHRTTIGRGVRTSVDTTLVAPVRIGDGAYTGAGSVITEDVPEGALGIARARQVNIDDYAARKAQASTHTADGR